MSRKFYTPADFPAGFIEDVSKDIARIEEGAVEGRLNPGDVEKIFAAVASHPAGRAKTCGSRNSGDSRNWVTITTLHVWWIAGPGGGRIVAWNLARPPADAVCAVLGSVIDGVFIDVSRTGKKFALSYFFPDRYSHLYHHYFLRRIRPLGVVVPEKISITNLLWVEPRLRMATVECKLLGVERMLFYYLLTPSGNVRFTYNLNVATPAVAVRNATGMDIPRGAATWEDVEPLFAPLVIRALAE